MIIGCVNKSAPPLVISPENPDPRPPLTKNNLSVLNQLECPVCLDILTQPMEHPFKAMACTQCIIHWVATTGSVPQCKKLDIRYGIFLLIFENIRLSTIFEIKDGVYSRIRKC